jgi:hypothetical protein
MLNFHFRFLDIFFIHQFFPFLWILNSAHNLCILSFTFKWFQFVDWNLFIFNFNFFFFNLILNCLWLFNYLNLLIFIINQSCFCAYNRFRMLKGSLNKPAAAGVEYQVRTRCNMKRVCTHFWTFAPKATARAIAKCS